VELGSKINLMFLVGASFFDTDPEDSSGVEPHALECRERIENSSVEMADVPLLRRVWRLSSRDGAG
jgi:hypothetical protein